MPKQKPLNWKYINKILKHIHEEPKRLWMPCSGMRKGYIGSPYLRRPPDDFPVCNTVGCFYGWSNILRLKHPKFDKNKVLGISKDTETKVLGFAPEEQEMVYWAGARETDHAEQMRLLKKALQYIVAARIASGEKSAKRIRLDYLD